MPAPAASRRWFPAGLAAAYALILAFGLAHHEMWRDELQAWLLEGSSFSPAPSRRYASVLLTGFLAVHAFAGLRVLMVALLLPLSLAERTAEHLRTDRLDSLPMIGEPDYAASAVLAFLEGKPSSMHYARGDRAGSFIRWDGAREPRLSDAELLSRTAALAAREDSPVVMVLNRPLLLPLERYPEIRPLVSFTGALDRYENFHLYLHDAPATVPAVPVLGSP